MRPDQDSKLISRRKFLTATATAIGGLTLAACGGAGGTTGGDQTGGQTEPDAAGATAAAPAPAGGTNITAWFWDDALQFAVDEFHKRDQNVRVKFDKLSYDDTHKKLLTSFAAGSGAPDVCAIEIGKAASFTARGGLADLLQAPYDAGRYKNDMVEYKWLQGTTQDGRLVLMPWDIGPAGLWYRTDLFEKAGLPTDPEEVQGRVKTWDDWLQLGKDLKAKTPNTALVADAFNDILYPMMFQQGQGWFKGNKLMAEEKATEPLQRAVEAREQGIDANIDWWGPEWATGLNKDAFAGMGIACWMQTFLSREQSQHNGKWRVIRAPEADYNWGGSFLSIPEQGKNKEAAWAFVQFSMCTAEGQNAIFKPSGIFPAYKPAWKDPLYDQPVDFYGGQKAYRFWTEVADSIKAELIQVHPNDQEVGDIVGAEITKVEKEGKDPVQAMKDAEAEALNRIQGIEA